MYIEIQITKQGPVFKMLNLELTLITHHLIPDVLGSLE